MMRHAILLAALALCACAERGPPLPTGQWQVLSPGAWDMDPRLATPPADLPKLTEAKD
jgi:hypothetical protein